MRFLGIAFTACFALAAIGMAGCSDGGGDGGLAADGGVDAPANQPETGTKDTGAPEKDSSTPEKDSSTPEKDGSVAPNPDSGTLAACVKGSTAPFTCAGVDATKALKDLTDADLAKYCDCIAAGFGGYGKTKCECSDKSTVTEGMVDQAACIAQLKIAQKPTCAATSGDGLTCFGLMHGDACNALGALQAPSCQAFLGCQK